MAHLPLIGITIALALCGIAAHAIGRYGADVKDWCAAKWNNAMIALGQ